MPVVGVGKAFLMMVAILGIALMAGIYVTKAPTKPHVTARDVKPVPNAAAWADRESYPPHPTPHATPGIIARAQNRMAEWRSGGQRKAPVCDQNCQSLRHLLAAAQGSGGVIQLSNRNTLEVPRNDPNAPEQISIEANCQHCVLKGSWFYAVLDTGIDSDRVGKDGHAHVTAHISQDVRDTVTQTELLIPHNSVVIGITDPIPTDNLNTTAVNVEWQTLRLPNGKEISLPDMPAADTEGYEGLTGSVNRHIVRTWAPAVMVSGIVAGMMLAQNPTYNSENGYNSSQQASSAFARTMGSHSMRQLDYLLRNQRPTIRIPLAQQFIIRVTKDLQFDQPYQS